KHMWHSMCGMLSPIPRRGKILSAPTAKAWGFCKDGMLSRGEASAFRSLRATPESMAHSWGTGGARPQWQRPTQARNMRQALITAPDRFEVVETPVPRLKGDGEVLVRTAACGICSGDLMPWYLEKKVGTVLGHEVVGWAVEIGKEVTHIRRGDLIFLHHHAPCFDCPECRRGAFVHCPTWRSSRLEPGGMAEWIRVPAENVRGDTFAVSDLTAEQAVFIEPLGCC